MEPYNVLQNLTQITKVTKDSRNTFLMMTNDTTHDVMMLQEPDYTPSQNVDNTDYEAEHADRFTVDGQTLRMETELQVTHYQSNMAALLQLGSGSTICAIMVSMTTRVLSLWLTTPSRCAS